MPRDVLPLDGKVLDFSILVLEQLQQHLDHLHHDHHALSKKAAGVYLIHVMIKRLAPSTLWA